MRRHGSFPDLAIAVAVVSGAAGMVGVYLDTAWHRTVGRDSFFILPHVFIYCGGLGVLGAALGSVTHATLGRAADFGGPILRLWRLQLPLGFAVTALGISVITAAAPVDAWWHDTFGKDVLIWSPPHLQLHLGAGIAAIGLLFAVAAQRGRGALAGAWLWRGAMLAVLVDLVHRGHFILAHYTMLDHARTPDLYPFLVALLVPVVLVAAARAVGPWAPTLACLLFLGVTWLIDVMLRAIEFERYTLTPILALPAAVLSLVFWGAERSRDGRGRARAAATAAVLLAVVGLAASYQPQRYGPSMTVDELGLVPLSTFPYQEAIFWNALLAEGWPSAPRIEARSEGIIDGLPMPVGPAWCAPTAAALTTALGGTRFGMEVNGTSVDLAPYPLVRLRLRDGAQCAWLGVASAFQRASQNRFVYSIDRRAPGRELTTRVVLLVTFKDP